MVRGSERDGSVKRRNSTASASDDINGGTKWGRFRVGAEVSIGIPSGVLAHPVIAPVEGRGGDLIKLLSCSRLRDREKIGLIMSKTREFGNAVKQVLSAGCLKMLKVLQKVWRVSLRPR